MQKYLLAALLFFTAPALAQYSFKGKLVDEQMLPIQGASLKINQSYKVAVSDVSGGYDFNFSSSRFILSISHTGFTTQTITVNAEVPDTIVLKRNIELLEETIVKAFERNAAAKEVAAAVTVLNKNSLERLGTASLVAAVNTVPGVKMDERSPGSYRLSIRGNLLRSTFGVRNVKVYWNGIPFTDANGNTYLNQLSPGNLSSMEIIKGPSGSMYGSGTGGVVLLNSAANLNNKDKWIDMQATGGSYGLFSGNVSYQQNGRNANTLSLAYQQSDGYRDHTNMRRATAHNTGSYHLAKKQRLYANVFYSDLFYQTPGGLNPAELAANPRQARPAAGAFPGAATQKAAIGLKTLYTGLSLENQFNIRWANITSLYGSYTDFKNPTIRNYEEKYEKGIGGRSVFQFKSGIFTGTFGGEIQQGFFYTSVFGNKAGTKDTLQFNADIQSRQVNIFAQSGFNFTNGFVLEAGLSYNDFYYGYEKIERNNNITESSSFSPQLVPRISLL
ncbi:MAG: TonB-dependent receptor plug domain-containing protein, partial [Gloeobacteraceae cyanobacterium ES-bin-316]|nr:TonB-dependent receptor plug domain-containing protein [Ferruginibacter sp.]